MATFIDNVAILGIENCLLDPLSRIFTSKRISSLEDEEVERLAAESSATLEERARLTSEMEMLQADYEELRRLSEREAAA